MIITRDEKTQEIIQTPETLYECFDVINDDINLEEWLKMSEKEAIASAHHGVGKWIRNEWGLWSEGRLKDWFLSMGIKHADDMSGIILTSYHRVKNNKDVNLEEQFDHYIEYWLSDEQILQRRRNKKLTVINHVL